MPHHDVMYRVYADEDTGIGTLESWRKADKFLNGWNSFFDKNEALARSKLAYKHSRHPIITMEIPVPMKKGVEEYPCWVIGV